MNGECEEPAVVNQDQNSNDSSNEISLKSKFHKKLIHVLTKFNLTFETANIWMLNQLIVPLSQGGNSNQLKPRYLTPENDFVIYNASPPQPLELDLKLELDESVHNVSVDETEATAVGSGGKKTYVSKIHVHTCYAIHRTGKYSTQLVVYPKDELEANMLPTLRRSTVIDETANGDINPALFLSWLKAFHEQAKVADSTVAPLILMCNSSIPVNSKETIQFCVENNIYLLFYPLKSQTEVFNRGLFLRFKDAWKAALQQYIVKDNPHSQLSFLFIYKHVLRTVLTSEPVKDCFREFLRIYRLPKALHVDNSEFFINGDYQVPAAKPPNGYNYGPVMNIVCEDASNIIFNATDDDENDENSPQQNGDLTPTTTAPTTTRDHSRINIVFTEQEINDYCEWIKHMSSIGCLCVKHTFLRDLSLKYHKDASKLSREILSTEKRWLDLVKKNAQKFEQMSNAPIYCFNETEYLTYWFDTDVWRSVYYRLAKEKLKIKSPSAIWTFDVIVFPCVVSNGNLLRAPERDFNRPRNLKPGISVLFAYNAAGDYLAPQIFYPLNFMDVENDDLNSENECYAQNGFINCKMFNTWLSQVFIPYIEKKKEDEDVTTRKKQDFLLLYCGKLAVVDFANMKLCRDSRVHLLNLTSNSVQPFQCLFQKNLRNRQTDLLLDSWRKVTDKQNLSYQFKIKTKLEFRTLFMETLQNCIEEIGDFKQKLISTFDVCKLWPINEEEYKLFLINGNLALQKKDKITELPAAEAMNNGYLTNGNKRQSFTVAAMQSPRLPNNSNGSRSSRVSMPVEIADKAKSRSSINGKKPVNGKRKAESDQKNEESEHKAVDEMLDDSESEVNDYINGEVTEDEQLSASRNNNSSNTKRRRVSSALTNNNSSLAVRTINTTIANIKSSETLKAQITSIKYLLNDLLKCLVSETESAETKSSESSAKKFDELFHQTTAETQERCETIRSLVKQAEPNAKDINRVGDLLVQYYAKQTAAVESAAYTVNNVDLKQLSSELLEENKLENLAELNLNLKTLCDLYSAYQQDAWQFFTELCHSMRKRNRKAIAAKRSSFLKGLMLKLYSNEVNDNNWTKCVLIMDENL